MQRELFEEMSVPKAYLKLAVPVVFAMVLGVVYNMVDAWFISLTGDPNLVAGVSICSPVFVLSVALGDIFGLGGGSLMSRLLGEKKDEEAGIVSAFCMCAAFVIGLVFMALMLVFHNPVLGLLGANEASMTHAYAYFMWIAAGMPFIVFTLVPNNLLRTEGLSSWGMWAAIAGTVANIILDPILIFTLHMGAGGAALATSLSNVLSCVMYLLIIRKKCHVISLDFSRAFQIAGNVKEILRIGIPASVTNIMFSLSMLLTNRALVSFGNEQVAAMGIAMRINMISQMTLIGFAFGAQPLFGYNYGSRNRERFKSTLRFAYGLEFGLGCLFALILYFFAPLFMRGFIADETVITSGTQMLRVMQISSVLVGFSLVATCVCQAVGHAKGALILSLCRQGILFFIAITVLPRCFGFTGILVSQPASDLLTGCLAFVIIAGILKKMQNSPTTESVSGV